MDKAGKKLIVKSNAFSNNGRMPVEYTGYGLDKSPQLELRNISPEAETIAIIMEDLDIPLIKAYPHWLIWNIPAVDEIPENIPPGESVASLDGAIQGVGYGKHKYRGPKPPKFIRKTHRYRFTVYILDSFLNLNSTSRKKELVAALKDHVIQTATIIGTYKNP